MPRPKKVVKQDPERADTFNYAMQLNKYRMMYAEKGFYADELWIEYIITEPPYAYESWGFESPLVMIPIPMLPDTEVDEYFKKKAGHLKIAMTSGHWNEPCDERERWRDDKGKDVKCTKFCDVNEFCPYWHEHYNNPGPDWENHGKDDPNQNSIIRPYGNI